MWKCKTCDKVNEDKLEICWGCYTPKRNNYIELKTGVDALFDDLKNEENRTRKAYKKIDKRFIVFIICNIPFVLMILFMISVAIALNGEGKGESLNMAPIVIILLLFGWFWLVSIKAILQIKNSGKILGFIFYPLTELVSGYYLAFGFTLPGWIGVACGFYCIYFLMFEFPNILEEQN